MAAKETNDEEALRAFLQSLASNEADAIKIQKNPLEAALQKANEINQEPWPDPDASRGSVNLLELIDWNAPTATSNKSNSGQ